MYSLRQVREALAGVSPEEPGTRERDISQKFKELAKAPHLLELVSAIRQEAKTIVTSSQPALPFSLFQLFETQGSRLEFEQPYFSRRARLAILALASLLDQTDEYLPTLENEIWEVCLEYSWALPAHLPVGLAESRTARVAPQQTVDLFAAETAQQLAETVSWLRSRLNPWIEYRVREEIEKRIYQPLFYDPHHFWWETSTMNWAAVCSGAVGITLLELETDQERQLGMLERILNAMRSFLEGFGEDGGCPEGISYWTYGFGYFVYFAEALHEYSRGKLDLLQDKKIKRIASFPNCVSLGKTYWVNYSDAPPQLQLETGLVSRLVKRLDVAAPTMEKIPALEKTKDHLRFRWVHLTRNLLWTDPALLQQPTLAGTFYLPDIQWLVTREYIGNTLIGFSAKGGHNDEPHNHNDLGHFLLFVGDESLLCELGAGLYTRDYFREKRYSFLHPSSLGHSVPVINGQLQQAGADNYAEVVQQREAANRLLFELDLTRAYPALANLQKFTRQFVWTTQAEMKKAQLELSDIFKFSAEKNSLEEVFISLIQPVIAAGKITWVGNQGKVTLTFDQGQFEARLETVQAYAKEGDLINIYRLCLACKSVAPEINSQFLFTCELSQATVPFTN
ncbi:MAG TPA: heparinase II/III family protein [Chloroflexia bacterium]|nr:heparinase II/III family protein [Chloroflexia bacterium]